MSDYYSSGSNQFHDWRKQQANNIRRDEHDSQNAQRQNGDMNKEPYVYAATCSYVGTAHGLEPQWKPPMTATEPQKGKKSMFTEAKEAIGEFLKEYKTIILWVATLFLVDHFFFNGKFRDRLNSMIDKLIGKVEKKVSDTL